MRAISFRAIERSVAVFVALAVQLTAIAVIGDIFAAAPANDATLAPTEPVARVAPIARGDRLMSINRAFEVVSVSAPAPDPLGTTEEAAAPALGAAPETAPEPEPAIAKPAPQPKPDPTPAPEPKPDPVRAPPPPASAPPAINTSLTTQQAEVRMLLLMNASRLQAGLVPLARDAGVSDAARRHSAVEAQVRYVYHDGPDGTAASRNVPACGTGWYGENTGKVWSGGVDALHQEFMAEPWEPINHRTNIMDPNFRRAGIGAVQGPDAVYVTVVFCR
jgi:uncharacterized protein YkwD